MMDIDRFQNDLGKIVKILDPYVTINGESYILDPSLRSDLCRVQEPVMKLLKQVDQIILKRKINDLKPGMGDELIDKIEEILGIS